MTSIFTGTLITSADYDHAIDNAWDATYIARSAVIGATGSGAYAIHSPSVGMRLTVAGQIFAEDGAIFSGGSTARIWITPDGVASSRYYTINITGSGEISNAGYISGYDAISVSGDILEHFNLNNTGTIEGYSYSITSTAKSVVHNSGDIYGYYGIRLSQYDDQVHNSGTIVGNISLNAGHDLIDTRLGIVRGSISGGAGDDTLYGSLTARNVLDGGDGEDLLVGGDADDILVGGAGADEMIGGGGIDAASYDTAGGPISVDLLSPWLNTGDAIGDSYDSIENLIGSSYGDSLFGDNGANVLNGGQGADTLYGRGGNDRIYGGAGNDVMIGDSGDDIYYVTDAGDTVVELASMGNDTVRSSVSFNIGAQFIETLILTGGDAINGTGNSQANTLQGNSAANVLDGRAGTDRLTGGFGADSFMMTTALSATNVDTITDFQVGVDKIGVDRSFFTQVGAAGALDPNAFGAFGAADASDRILYDSATGTLYYDSDGSGAAAAVAFAIVTPGLGLTANDFFVVL